MAHNPPFTRHALPCSEPAQCPITSLLERPSIPCRMSTWCGSANMISSVVSSSPATGPRKLRAAQSKNRYALLPSGASGARPPSGWENA